MHFTRNILRIGNSASRELIMKDELHWRLINQHLLQYDVALHACQKTQTIGCSRNQSPACNTANVTRDSQTIS